jgi:hypothetical protein
MKNTFFKKSRRFVKISCLCTLLALFFACVEAETPSQPAIENKSNHPAETRITTDLNTNLTTATSSNTISIVVASNSPPSSKVTVIQITPSAILASNSTNEVVSSILPDASPLIFTGIGLEQKCGHGDIVAFDGHTLHSTPNLPRDNSNFLDLLPEGSQVDIIDCRLWTDEDDFSWLAVRTPSLKLGWMLIQSDKFYITLYPVHVAPPISLTGIPAGTMVAYVPPSNCEESEVSNKAVATSLGIDLIPAVGDIKGINDAIKGCDTVTGEDLGNWRWFGLFGIIGLSEIALLRHGDEVADGVRIASNLEGGLRYSDELSMAAIRNGDETALATIRNAEYGSLLLRNGDSLGSIGDDISDVGRIVDNSPVSIKALMRAVSDFEQPCSFSAETKVATSLGLKPISEIQAGDLVLAYHEGLEARGYYTVTHTFNHLDPIIVSLEIDEDIIYTTTEHPFLSNNQWMKASRLNIGSPIRGGDGVTGKVSRIHYSFTPQVMYNLTVEEAHTYFVGIGQWLVHNACSRVLRRNLAEDANVKVWNDSANPIPWQAHHIIPQQHESHDFIKRASNSNWNIDGAQNGLALPKWEDIANETGLPAHRGSHSQYNNHARQLLDQAETRAAIEGWSDIESMRYLENTIVPELKRYLRSFSGQRLP